MHFTVGQKKLVTHIKKEKGSTLILLTTECKSDASQQTFSFCDEEDSGSSPQTSHCTQTTSHSNKIDSKLTKLRWNVRKTKVCGEILFSDNKLKIMKLSPSWQFKKGGRGLKKKKKTRKTVCLHSLCLSCPLQGAEGGNGVISGEGLWEEDGWMKGVAPACNVERAASGSLHAVAKALLRYLLTVSCRGRLVAITIGLLWGHGDTGSRCQHQLGCACNAESGRNLSNNERTEIKTAWPTHFHTFNAAKCC